MITGRAVLRWVLALALVAGTLVALAGCTSSQRVPSKTPDMQGAKVIGQSGSGADRTLRMEVDVDAARQAGIPDAGTGYAVASVRVNDKTVLLRETDTGTEPASIEDVVAARFLNVWFTGAVAESYPVQAVAGTILVLK